MEKKWCIRFLVFFILIMVVFGGATIVTDPYFHYRKPSPIFQYQLADERYQNDGIVKHFDYNAIITGTSMARNFKTTEFDELFHASSIKVPFLGGTFREVNENLERAFKANPQINVVVRTLDNSMLENDAAQLFSEDLPDYLYDENPLNDVKYFLNMNTLLEGTVYDCLLWTLRGKKTTSFDDYLSNRNQVVAGAEKVLEAYERPNHEDYERLELNRVSIEENFIAIAAEHPETQFYYFFPPYSVVWFDSLTQKGQFEEELNMQEEAAKLLLPYDNGVSWKKGR